MANHLSLNEIERYGTRALSPQAMLSADRHLAMCAQCRATLNRLQRSAYSIASVQKNLRQAAREDAAHLAFERLEAYVDGRAGAAERQHVDQHLETCQLCAREVSELQQFASTMAAGVERVPEITTLPLGKRLLSLFGLSSNWSFSMTAVSAVAVLLLLGIIVSSVYFQSYRTATPPIARHEEPENPPPTEPQPAHGGEVQKKTDSPPEVVQPVQPEKKAAPVIAFFVLKPAGTREGGDENTLTVPKDARIVEILLGVEGQDYRSYQTEVRTLQGRRIWNRRLMPRKTSKGKAIIVQLPADLLKQDAYALKLTGHLSDGGTEELEEYFFTIKR